MYFKNSAIQHSTVKLTWEEKNFKKYDIFYDDNFDMDDGKINYADYLGELSSEKSDNDENEEENLKDLRKKLLGNNDES